MSKLKTVEEGRRWVFIQLGTLGAKSSRPKFSY